MKNILFVLVAMVILSSCANNQEEQNKASIQIANNSTDPLVFGEEITFVNAAGSQQLPSLMDSTNELKIKLIGKVVNVCQMSGCWLEMDLGNNQIVHVTFRDEGFVVPKDISGKSILIEGIATTEFISIKMLRKIAKKEGKTKEQIAAIKAPVKEYYFEAVGVVIK